MDLVGVSFHLKLLRNTYIVYLITVFFSYSLPRRSLRIQLKSLRVTFYGCLVLLSFLTFHFVSVNFCCCYCCFLLLLLLSLSFNKILQSGIFFRNQPQTLTRKTTGKSELHFEIGERPAITSTFSALIFPFADGNMH